MEDGIGTPPPSEPLVSQTLLKCTFVNESGCSPPHNVGWCQHDDDIIMMMTMTVMLTTDDYDVDR